MKSDIWINNVLNVGSFCKHLVVIVLAVLCSVEITLAQQQDVKTLPFIISGNVINKETDQPAMGAKVELCDSAGNVLHTKEAGAEAMELVNLLKKLKSQGAEMSVNNSMVELVASFRFGVPRIDKQYILKVSNGERFDTTYVDIKTKANDTEGSIILPDIYLERRARSLDEVTVATKVKFFYRGDTLIYNADAFNLPDGSMLNDLLEAIDCKISSLGEITHKGRRVETLLLNGKQFFENHRLTMLENIDSYMVGQVKCYESTGELSRITGVARSDDKHYTLDVRLKREYSFGTVVNVGAGVGTSNRYMGRLFALSFTNRTRFSLIGNINNVTDRKPGSNDEFNMLNTSTTGTERNKEGAFDYMFEPDKSPWKINGEVGVKHFDVHSEYSSKSTYYMPDGETYSRSASTSQSKSIDLNTNHTIAFRHKRLSLELRPRFSFYQRESNSLSTSAMLNKDISLEDVKLLLEGHPDSLRQALANRSQQNGFSNQRSANSSLSFHGSTSIPNTTNAISIDASIENKSESSNNNSIYNIIYGDGASPTDRRQLERNHPNHDLQYDASLSYSPYNVNSKILFNVNYRFSFNRRKRATEFYLFKREAEATMSYGFYNADDVEMTAILDGENSKTTLEKTTKHNVNVSVSGGKKFRWQIGMPLQLWYETLDFSRMALDTTLSRTYLRLNPQLDFSYNTRSNYFRLSYNYSKGTVPLLSLINVNNTINPLNYYDGNPNLHAPSSHNLSFNSNFGVNNVTSHRVYMQYKISKDQIVQGYSYDPATGIRRYKPMNVSGVWSLLSQYDLNTTLLKKIEFNSSTSLNYNKGVDMVGYDGSGMSKNVVNNYNASETLKLGYTSAGQTLEMKAYSAIRRAASNRKDFQSFTAADINYTLTGKFSLPFNFRILTDLTLYTRYGYTLSAINKNRIVWNARLVYPFMKGRLVMMLDGFDILRQIENVEYTINSQGRTESYSNVIPRYMMLHVQYRINNRPRSVKRVAI